MKFRETILESGGKIFLGKNAENNDELMNLFRGKENLIMHTVAPGSPFCVIEKLNPTKEEIKEAGIICASKSQDWRDNKTDVKVHIFSGKKIKKPILPKSGTWKITGDAEVMTAKKKDISKLIKSQ